MIIEHSLCDGDGAPKRRNRLKIDFCGFRNGFDRNIRILNSHRIYHVAVTSRQIDLNHLFLGVWRCWRTLCPCKKHFHTLRPKNSRLWDIWSRFDLIFVSVVLHVMTQMHVPAGSSHSIWSPQTVFTDFWVSVTLDDCWMQSLWRRQSPRVPKSVENWCVWVRIRFWSKSQKINNQFCLSDFSKRFKDIRFH